MTDWLMVILTGLATLLVWRTVIYTRGALDEAEKATAAANRTVDETRRIGEAQVRAYLSITSAENKISSKGMRLNLIIKNTGFSPTRNVEINASIFYLGKLIGEEELKSKKITNFLIPQVISSSSQEKVVAIWEHDDIQISLIRSRRHSDDIIKIILDVTWTDVFNKENSQAYILANLGIGSILKRLDEDKRSESGSQLVPMFIQSGRFTTPSTN